MREAVGKLEIQISAYRRSTPQSGSVDKAIQKFTYECGTCVR